MNIVQIIPAFPPSNSYGGAPIVAYKMCKILAENGNNVTVFTTDANNSNSRLPFIEKREENLTVHYSKNISNYLAYNYKIFLSPEMDKLLKNKLHGSDIIHMHDYRTIQNILAYKYAKKFIKPYVIQPHGAIPRSNGKRGLKFIYDICIGDKILRNSSKLLVFNRMEMNRCKEAVNPKRIQIIPNGIDMKNYSNLPEGGLFRDRYDLSPDSKLILYVGRIHPSKGLDLLIRAFSRITTKVKNSRLIFVGPDDGYLDSLKRLSATLNIYDKIIFAGYLNHREKLSSLIDADVFVTPKFYGFPLTFLEAMACGTPIVTTNGGDYLEWIDNRIGLVTDYSEQKLEQAIIQILLDNDLRDVFSKCAKKDVQYFDWDNIVSELELIYKSVM